MSQTRGLTVRQHEREGASVPFEFVVSPTQASQVRFSTSSTAIGPQMIRGEAMDISAGGMGLQCRQFLPRLCEGTVRVFAPQSDPPGALGGTDELELMFEQQVKVRRVRLIGREPAYSLGVAFMDGGPALDQKIASLLDRVQRSAVGGQRAPESRSLTADSVEGTHA